jgi:hypothetical protein
MQCTYKKGNNSLNKIQEHCVYITLDVKRITKYTLGRISIYIKVLNNMRKPPKKMKHDIDMNKTINLTFKLDILYSNMHKYKVHKMENHYIQYFDSTSSICYNNFKRKPTSDKKYWYLIKNNIICKC